MKVNTIKVLSCLTAISIISSASILTFADKYQNNLTIGSSEISSYESEEYDYFDLVTGEWDKIPTIQFYDDGADLTVPSQPGSDDDEMIPLTQEEIESIQKYYSENSIDVEPYQYDGSWVKVNNTGVNPYKAIARLKITWSDGSVNVGSAFAVGDGVVLTSAHCLYDHRNPQTVRRIDLYFGLNGGYSYKITTGKSFFLSPGWKKLSAYDESKDYAAIVIDKSVTKSTGTLSYSTVRPGLNTNDIVLTGYPWVSNNSPYNSLNCYKDIGSVTGFYSNYSVLTHNLNCITGDSGAPVYRDYGNDWVICGIHSGDYTEQTTGGVAKTIDTKVVSLINTAQNSANNK